MMESSTVLNNNSLAFIGLCNEYCQTLESARETECDQESTACCFTAILT